MRAAGLQLRVIWALLLREVHTRYGRENIGFLWMVGEPALFCGGVAIAWTAMRPPHEHGLPMTAFVITGYVPLTMWRHAVSRCVKAFEANGSLLFHRQVTPLDILLARVALEVAGTLLAGLAVAGAAALAGFMEPPANLGMLYLGLGCHAAFCLACGLVVAPLSERSDVVERALGVLMYLSLPFSGVFAMAAWLPPGLRRAMLWSPSVHSIEMIRAGQFGSSVHAQYDLGYEVRAVGLLLLLGLSLTLRVRRHLVVQ